MQNTLRSTLFAGLLLALIGSLLLFAMPNAAQSQVGTATPTGLRAPALALGAGATPTRPRSALASPTPNIPEPLLTLTALNAMISGTLESRPTATPGISEIALNGKPHFIRFAAAWCQPCRQMRPAVQAVRSKYGGRVNFWEVDVDNSASKRLVQRYNVQFIPHIVLLDSRGRTFRTLEGLQTQQELDRAIRALLANE
ncbi:MAG: thioredoxin fold domain-containing protein [Chloroflexi bacterium]|nr:thioredoxin fold domain-containing protein [Chloroflexota bacterium]